MRDLRDSWTRMRFPSPLNVQGYLAHLGERYHASIVTLQVEHTYDDGFTMVLLHHRQGLGTELRAQAHPYGGETTDTYAGS